MTYILSIEPKGERAFQEKFHLGTDLKIAKDEAEKRFHGRNAFGMATTSVALINADTRKLVDVFDGEWSSERA
jgi:hypothetical protein